MDDPISASDYAERRHYDVLQYSSLSQLHFIRIMDPQSVYERKPEICSTEYIRCQSECEMLIFFAS